MRAVIGEVNRDDICKRGARPGSLVDNLVWAYWRSSRIFNGHIATIESMEKVVKLLSSFSQADEEDKRFYRSLTPAQRLDILLTLVAQRQAMQANETTEGFKRVYRTIKCS
jgi:hypothetical protein